MSRRDSRVSSNGRMNDTLTEFENFKKKFLLANKHITKINAVLSVRVEELQAQISSLHVEILQLRTSKIELVSQLEKEQEKSGKILADAEAATSGLLKHFGFLRQSLNVGSTTPPVSAPSQQEKARRTLRRIVSDLNTSSLASRRPHAPNLSGISEEEEMSSPVIDEDVIDYVDSSAQPQSKDALSRSRSPLLGDMTSSEDNDVTTWYSPTLSSGPSNQIDILVERSKTRASEGLWKDALRDAEEVIKLDPSLPWGYERKHAALNIAQDYAGAIDAFFHMLSVIESSPNEEIRQLRENFTTPHETIAAVDTAIHEIFSRCPLVLIDVTMGRLCNAEERAWIFKSDTPCKKLVSEMATTTINRVRIHQVVAHYFKWVMLSHTWDGKEPTFKDVNLAGSIWDLGNSPLSEKLRQYCKKVREGGYRWAWSDTCCIDKDTSTVLSQSLTSMYSWYEEAAETLVYLADVPPLSKLGDLTKSRWMTRAWTLQELLASKAVRFYNSEWKPYLNDMHTNHKESPAIRQELADAMGVAPQTFTHFWPEDLGVREKLRLASTRSATVEEDIAYSLIGIFSSDISPRYGLGKTAIGQLLEDIVARSGDVTVFAWTGQSLPYNSALPASLAVYNQTPYSPPPKAPSELDACVAQLRTELELQVTLTLYQQVIQLPRATFSNRCLQLPCIVFSVTRLGIQELGNDQRNLYRATVSLLGNMRFRTADTLPLNKPRKLVFVHPWLHGLHDPLDGFVSDNESDSESKFSVDPGELNGGPGYITDSASVSVPPFHAEPLSRMDLSTCALRLIARLGHPFNALLLEQQSNGQFKRIAAEQEIILPGVPYQTNPKDIRVKVLEII